MKQKYNWCDSLQRIEFDVMPRIDDEKAIVPRSADGFICISRSVSEWKMYLSTHSFDDWSESEWSARAACTGARLYSLDWEENVSSGNIKRKRSETHCGFEKIAVSGWAVMSNEHEMEIVCFCECFRFGFLFCFVFGFWRILHFWHGFVWEIQCGWPSEWWLKSGILAVASSGLLN